jgi:hypothetical protein
VAFNILENNQRNPHIINPTNRFIQGTEISQKIQLMENIMHRALDSEEERKSC